MNKKTKALFAVSAILGLSSFSVVAAEEPAEASSPEVMTDRCSGEVAFTPNSQTNPTAHGTVILKRGHDGYSPPTTFTVTPDKDGYVRWWCHSTVGNTFDPGTWRVHVNDNALNACLISVITPVDADGVTGVQCSKSITITSSAFQGWTAERSRCADHKGKLRARLGPDRLLTTECL